MSGTTSLKARPQNDFPHLHDSAGFMLWSATFASVRNWTASLPSRCHYNTMRQNKNKTRSDRMTLRSVKKEMAKPRMARSARITELNLDTARISDQPSTTMPGIVEKVIPPSRPSQPEKAQIAVDRTARRHRKLKKGAHVEVTIQ